MCPYLEVEELLSDDAGEGGAHEAALDGPLRQAAREQVNVVQMSGGRSGQVMAGQRADRCVGTDIRSGQWGWFRL